MSDRREFPITFNIFKGGAAARFSVVRPEPQSGDRPSKPGYVYLDIAKAIGPNPNDPKLKSYDWNNKIGVKLGVSDIMKIGYALSRGDSSGSLFHEYNGDTKVIDFNRVEGQSPYFLSVSAKISGKESKISLPIAREEAFALSVMMQQALSTIHKW